MGAIAGPSRRWQAGVSGTAAVAVIKEGGDILNGLDTKGQGLFHALSIMAGAGIVAAFWH